MTHFFDVDIAKEYGVHSSIILESIAYWVAHNEANEIHYHDGRYWTYNSIKAFSKLFPYLTGKQIRSAIANLIDNGIIMTGNYNSMPYDRTLWYALTDKGESILHERKIDLPNKENTFALEGKPIPLVNTLDKPLNKESKESDFDKFWDAYPRKVNKPGAKKAFLKVEEDVDVLINAIEQAKKSTQWQEADGKYIPHPTTWLNQERWNDVVESKVNEEDVWEQLLAKRSNGYC